MIVCCAGRHNARSATTTEPGQRRRGRRKRKGGEGRAEDDTKPAASSYFSKSRFKSALGAVNLHNNRAGRRVSAVRQSQLRFDLCDLGTGSATSHGLEVTTPPYSGVADSNLDPDTDYHD